MSESGVDLSGRSFGNWKLIRLLGEGAFGGVYEAQNVGIAGRRAAVKVLHPHMSFHPDIKRRFINEASAASRAEHENIVQVFDGGVTDDGTCYAVMELLKGQPLSKVIQSGRLDVARVVNIGVQVASALRAAHQIGIVHRDLKPDNVFVVPRETNPEFVKVLDFGVAKLAADMNDGKSTKTGMLIGTPGYMSPEQWQTLPDIDGRADIYALGVILFECATGLMPFTAASTYEWLAAHLNQPPPDPASLIPHAAPLSPLILRMLAKRREDRPADMSQVIAELQSAGVAPRTSGARVIAPTMLAPDTAAPAPVAAPASRARGGGTAVLPEDGSLPPEPAPRVVPPQESRPAPPPPRPKWPLALAVAVPLVAVGGWLVFRQKPSPPPPPPPDPPAVNAAPAAPAANAAPPAPEPVAPLGMVAVPAAKGTFEMGREDYGHPGALDVPAHEADVSAFAIARTAVSIAEYAEYVEAEHARAPWGKSKPRDPKAPVTNVSLDDARAYCRWRHPPEGRLPIESEWEWAARGQAGALYPWGKTFRQECVPARRGKSGAPDPVDAHADCASPAGLLGMAGNVWEWTSSPAVLYSGAQPPPKGFFVVRGGSYFNTDDSEVTATSRHFVDRASPYVGFRCAAPLQR
jgi:serine/threonine-protein kinase